MSVVNVLPPETVLLSTFVLPVHHSTTYPVALATAAHDTVMLVDFTFDVDADAGAAGGATSVVADVLA